MKYLNGLSIILNFLLAAFLVYLFWTKDDQNTQVIQNVTIDSTLVKRELQKLYFDNVSDTNNTNTVYVTEKQIERYYNEQKPIYNYYYDSTLIVNNNERIVSIKETKDTVINDDGVFRMTALSESNIYGLGLDYELNQLVVTKTITQLPKHQFFVGGSVGGNLNQFILAPEFQYFRNGKHGFKYQFDVINQTHQVGYLHQIDLSKPPKLKSWLN